MLRFYDVNCKENENIRISEETLTADEEIWKNCVSIDKQCSRYHDNMITVVPVKNREGTTVAYGYQDNEANRELRMIKELTRYKDVLQFDNVFPDKKEVVICGCNELAVSFAKYIGMLDIKVSVTGKYWEWFGYDNDLAVDLDGEGKLVIFAEGVVPHNGDLVSDVRRSVSCEFECIDKIYEANVLEGKIQNTIGSFDDLICRINKGQKIVILGCGNEAQDAYDLLLGNGIEIYGFAVETKARNRLFGKVVMNIDEALRSLYKPIFLECHNRNSALGDENTEYFDYHGYERNKSFFVLRDYTDIPVSNLVHVLSGKKVILAGDRQLCKILYQYLQKVESSNISVKCTGLDQNVIAAEDDLVCNVFPDYKNRLKDAQENRMSKNRHYLLKVGVDDYTEYFTRSRSFALIDEYFSKDNEKYTIPALTPKGILLGRIPCASGNYFLRGIMDGHPQVLLMPYSDLNENLFWYCVRLAENASGAILENFWEMYDEEAYSRQEYFPDSEGFETSCKRFLRIKESFTSQELFVMFHIAYAEMLSGTQILDVSNLIIYWEPHFVSRYDMSFFSGWLSDKKVNVQSITLRRDNIIRTGSVCARVSDLWNSASEPFRTMFEDGTTWGEVRGLAQSSEFKMRFEDIKLNPHKTLSEVCRRMDIEWSDTMLKTTSYGQTLSYRGSADFTLKPVFNKYADFLSEFDRFRISIASSPYQKKYGYIYENCLKFSRREIQEMFMKPFLFEGNEKFKLDDTEYMKIREYVKWKLWDVRKHMVLDDIHTEFEQLEIK